MRSPTTKTSGWPGSEQSGNTSTRPDRSQRRARLLGQARPEWRALHPGCPDLGAGPERGGLAVGTVDLDPVVVDAGHHCLEVDLDPEPGQISMGFLGQPGAEFGQHARAAVEE